MNYRIEHYPHRRTQQYTVWLRGSGSHPASRGPFVVWHFFDRLDEAESYVRRMLA